MDNTKEQLTRISFLFHKYLDGTCSSDEVREIMSVLEDSENDHSLFNAASSYWLTLMAAKNGDISQSENQLIFDHMLDQLHHRMRLEEEKIYKKFTLGKVFSLFSKVAAILILPLLAYSFFLTSGTSTSGPRRSIDKNQIVWQTVKTTVGMQTDFLLPDSSHVWLNSGSVLKYPNHFASDYRQVQITGEAFFDVAKDSLHPFLVNAGKMNIEVKGTKFNVINYSGEPTTELILTSGKVRLFSGNYEDHNTITTVNPGQLAILDNTRNRLSVKAVDVSKYTAWKEGILIFRDDKMDEVVRKLDRWFNIEIILQSPELNAYVYTAIYRDETLPQILELLKISAPIKYSFSDRERLSDNSYKKRKVVITKRK